jgi:osmotically-inducible protein OsmY
VTITGTAPTEAVKKRVDAKVRTIPGVVDVVNDLKIDPEKRAATTPKRDK